MGFKYRIRWLRFVSFQSEAKAIGHLEGRLITADDRDWLDVAIAANRINHHARWRVVVYTGNVGHINFPARINATAFGFSSRVRFPRMTEIGATLPLPPGA